MSDKNQSNSFKEPNINPDGHHENFQESKSSNAINPFKQEDDKKPQSNQ